MKKLTTELFKEIGRFITVGIFNTALGFAVFNIFAYYIIGLETSWQYIICSVFTFAITTTNSFFFNSRFTFRHKQSNGGLGRFVAVTAGTFIFSGGISVGIFHLLRIHTPLSGILIGNISAAVSVAIGMCTNFFGYKFFVFHDHVEHH